MVLGPRGGKYKVSVSGKKESVKKSTILNVIKNFVKIEEFVEKFRKN